MTDEIKFMLAIVLGVCVLAALAILGDWLDGDDCMARITLLDPAWTETLICEDGTADVVEIRGQTFLRCTCPLEEPREP